MPAKKVWLDEWNSEILTALKEKEEYNYSVMVQAGLSFPSIYERIRELANKNFEKMLFSWDKKNHIVKVRKPAGSRPKSRPRSAQGHEAKARAIRSNKERFMALCEKDGDKYPINVFAVTEVDARMVLESNYQIDKILDLLPAKEYREKYKRPL